MRATGPEQQTGEAAGPTDRTFGLFFGLVFAVVGLLPLAGGGRVRSWALLLALACVLAALAAPRTLAPANRLWLRIGLLLHRVVNPVVMAVLFYGVVTPFGLAVRTLRPDLARRLRPDRTAATYWVERRVSARMDRQF